MILDYLSGPYAITKVLVIIIITITIIITVLGIGLQDLAVARQEIYHLSHAPILQRSL
jgi:hypothetical protein